MKDMIQRMTDLESQEKQALTESEQLAECPPMDGPDMSAMDRGNPVSISVNMNASGKEHVEDLLDMMKKAGLGGAEEVKPDMMPMRMDMERLRDIVDPEEDPKMLPKPGDKPMMAMDAEEVDAEDELEEYENEPEEEYKDTEYMTKDLAGGLNREKKAYKAAQDGDNAMAVETALYNELMAQYKSKK